MQRTPIQPDAPGFRHDGATAAPRPRPTVLAFDVFGTVVDWRGSLIRELARCPLGQVPDFDAGAFADAWRAGYQPAMQAVRSGARDWVSIDVLHREILDGLLSQQGLDACLNASDRAHLNLAWHRLDPWPDTVGGLQRLRARRPVCTLSNGNMALLCDMARHAGLPWDCILSAELFQAYKPDPRTYLSVARLFGVDPGSVMLVAAHKDDLLAARACGLQTAHVQRPFEHGDPARKDISAEAWMDLHARDLHELADLLDG